MSRAPGGHATDYLQKDCKATLDLAAGGPILTLIGGRKRFDDRTHFFEARHDA
jgi:hypothetical protein